MTSDYRLMTPFFSIIIPVYNVAPYLRECLDSVLAQTFDDWEAICVDDGSTDGSGALLDEYAAKDKRFRVIHQKNAGVSVARNRGLEVANGEWIGFLDADDVWAEEWLNEIVLGIEDEVDWIRTGWTDWDMDSGSKTLRLNEIEGVAKKVFVDDLISIGWYLVSRCGFPFVNFYRHKLLAGMLFPQGVRFREDALFCYKIVLCAKAMKVLLATGYFRRERQDSAMFSPRRRNDTINLLFGYVELWQGVMSKLDDPATRVAVIASSTFWVRKDILQWFELCAERTARDAYKVWILTRELLRLGAISWEVSGTRYDRFRWKLYLATGFGRVLLMNRTNLLGRRKKVYKK